MSSGHGERLSVMAIGAHMDDPWMGMGGAALKAARKGYRVTMVQGVSVYGAWPVVSGREAEIKPVVEALARDAGIELVTLGHDYMRLENGAALTSELSHVLADLRPDILFCHAEDDSNQDHVALGTASRVAAMHGACFLKPEAGYQPPREIMQCRSAWQTNNFRPDTFLDVTEVALDLMEILNVFDAIYNKGSSRPLHEMSVTDHALGDRTVALTTHTMHKFATCVEEGKQCGVRYAEGYMSYKRAAVGAELLARL